MISSPSHGTRIYGNIPSHGVALSVMLKKRSFSGAVKTIFLFSLALLLVFSLSFPVHAEKDRRRVVRIGAFNYYPGIFQDKDGVIKGFYVDALADIARRENIRFEYVYGSWSEGLARLKAGEVDVLTSVAFTPERAVFMDYSKTPLLTVWGELYVRPESEIDGIRQVRGKTIAVMTDDVNARHFVELTRKFDIPCRFVELPGFEEVFRAIAAKQVDAGVVNCTFGVPKHKEYGLRSTGVIFNPFDIYFSVAKGRNRALLALLDSYLVAWRHQQDSVYNTARQKWAHGLGETTHFIPRWVMHAAAVAGALGLVAVAFIVLLRRQVRRATHEILKREESLRESESKFRSYIDNSPEGVFVTDENGCYLEVNRAACAMTGYTEAELLAMCIKDLFQPEHAAASHYFQTLKKNGALSCEVEFLHKNGTIRWRSIDAVKLSDTCYLGFTKDVTERKKAEEFLQASLAEKEVLLREVHHRVKNNLASIVGLIDLQRSAIQEPHAVKMLVELSERIRSMSLVHEKLYRSESLSQINCQEYLDDLIFQLRCSYETRDVHFEVTAEGVEMPLDIAVPFGLIINELVTNALKYAFPDKKPRTGTGDCRIRVLLAQKNETYTLSVADNGVGLPEGFDWITAKTLGLVLVRMLGQHQLGGTYELNQEQGTRFTLTCSAGNIPCVRGTNPPHAA